MPLLERDARQYRGGYRTALTLGRAARYTYAHLEFPGLTEAVERGDHAAALAQVTLLNAAIARNTDYLRSTLEGWQDRR